MENPFLKENMSPDLQKAINDMFVAPSVAPTPVQAKPEQELQIRLGRSGGFVVIEFNPARAIYKISPRDAKNLAKRLINEALK